jgi:hypothetical protein
LTTLIGSIIEEFIYDYDTGLKKEFFPDKPARRGG